MTSQLSRQKTQVQSQNASIVRLEEQLRALKKLVEFRSGPGGHVPPAKGYLLAMLYSRGYASAEIAADMCAGAEHQGQAND